MEGQVDWNEYMSSLVGGTIEVQLATPFDIVVSFVLPVACATCLFGYLAFRLVAKMVNRGVGR